MQHGELVEKLMNFGLTRQEAIIYQYLVACGEATGYEVAKEVGISRSNAYNSLKTLSDKGGAYLKNGVSNKYSAVSVSELCGNKIKNLENDRKILEENLREKEETDGYFTILGYQNIQDKIFNMLKTVQKRVYISIENQKLPVFKEVLSNLVLDEKKVVIITNEPPGMEGFNVYLNPDLMKDQIRLIVDSRYVLTGDYGEKKEDTCLYSGQKNFAVLFKEAMRNEIELIQLRSEEKYEN